MRRLEAFKTVSKQQFLSDQDALDIACHRLLVATEATINLCYHVSAKQLRKAPGEYTECFDLLQQAEIIPADLAKRLQQMVRFRNLLVHMYWKLDYERVYEIIHSSRLSDLRTFVSIISSLIQVEMLMHSSGADVAIVHDGTVTREKITLR